MPPQMVTSFGSCPGIMIWHPLDIGTIRSVLVSHLLRRFLVFDSSRANSPAAGGPHLCLRLRSGSAAGSAAPAASAAAGWAAPFPAGTSCMGSCGAYSAPKGAIPNPFCRPASTNASMPQGQGVLLLECLFLPRSCRGSVRSAVVSSAGGKQCACTSTQKGLWMAPNVACDRLSLLSPPCLAA
jgi:hypothetical protein